MKETHVIPVSVGDSAPAYTAPEYGTPEQLTAALNTHGYDVQIGKALKGGTVSQVYEAHYNNSPVIVKHTENLIPFDPTELALDKNGHNIDTHVLTLFRDTNGIRIPRVTAHIPEITTTIMEDLRIQGFSLMQDRIIQKTLDTSSARAIGTMLAKVIRESKTWKPFPTNETAEGSIYERGLELRLAYPNTQKEYLDLERQFTRADHWIWPDGHPKNMFINDNGDIAFIDFGRSHWGDQRYMLPNFLAHIVLYSIAGYIPTEAAKEYVTKCVAAYRELESIDESIFCRYLAMEVLHRANGKWITGIETNEQKTALYQFGLSVFDDSIHTISGFLSLLPT